MPVTPENVSDLNYDVKELFLDVRLSSISINNNMSRNESGFYSNSDFTGRPTFNTGFFRSSTGFGITNIKVTTNASLQPTLDIEFKDLYGKTVFGELNGAEAEAVNYKALFQWPPPKFEFTFKGYLGKPVTWLLNMKTTSTQYNSDDGSYTIGATFIPNQWGMFADIPFLYLFAVKGLKAINLEPTRIKENTEEYKEKTESIIDFMYIGKKLEVAKKQVSKEYDSIVGSLQAFKSDVVNAIITGQIPIASIAPEGETPNLIKSGVPGNGSIDGFVNLAILLPDYYKGKTTAEEIEAYLKVLPPASRASENIRIKAATWGYLKTSTTKTLNMKESGGKYGETETKFADPDTSDEEKKAAKQLDGIIEENINLIDNQIKATIYDEYEGELEKTTIKSIFGRIAKDTAYIMGYIIDAGEQGYFNNKKIREDLEKKNQIIGQYFPMEFIDIPNPTDKETSVVKKQVPTGVNHKVGEDEFEKKFVSQFITAVSFGIAQNRSLQAAASAGENDAIKFRVNNIEILADNPFLNITDWKEIASIIMKRAGIAGYLTKNEDPNRPGWYPDKWFFSLNPEKMRKLADKDLANITDSVLAGLEPGPLESLNTFCLFWMNLILDADGTDSGTGVSFQAARWRGGNVTESKLNGKSLSVNCQIFVKSLGNKELMKSPVAIKVITYIETLGQWTPEKRIIGTQLSSELLYDSLVAAGIIDEVSNSFKKESRVYLEMRDAGFEAWTVEEYLEQFIGPKYLFFGRSTKQGYSTSPDGTQKEQTDPTLLSTASFYDTIAPFVNFNGLSFAHIARGSNDEFEYLWFRDEVDVAKLTELQPMQGTSDSEDAGLEQEEKDENNVYKPKGVLIIDSPTHLLDTDKKEDAMVYGFWSSSTNKQPAPGIQFWEDFKGGFPSMYKNQFLDYEWCKGANEITDIVDGKTIAFISEYEGNTPEKVLYISINQVLASRMHVNWGPTDKPSYNSSGGLTAELPEISVSTIINPIAQLSASYDSISSIGAPGPIEYINPKSNPMAVVVYAQEWKTNSESASPVLSLFGSTVNAIAVRSFLRKFCVGLSAKIIKTQDETNEIFGQILGKAGESEDLIYQQFHSLFHQWQILGSIGGERINSSEIKVLTPKAANKLEKIYGGADEESNKGECGETIADESNEVVNFRYDYPLQSIEKGIDVGKSIINIESLYNAKANTTVLNIFQQVCTKNNFMFFPIPGNSRYKCVEEIFTPVTYVRNPKVGNFFQILFNPTPESRSLHSGDSDEPKSLNNPKDFTVDAFPVKFGDPSNKIVKNVTVSTDDNKVTAESIVNLQKIVDNEDNSRTVTTDCSLLSVFEGRSYKTKVEVIGNAQISPMQFFYLENHTIFTGLYQIIKVNHNITPNDMTTDFEGIKMRFAGGSYGGILPITLDDFKNANTFIKNAPLEIRAESEEDAKRRKAALDSTGKTYSNSSIVGSGKGEKAVAGYLKNKTTKRNIDDLIVEAVKQGITNPKTIAGILSIISKESSFVAKFENVGYSLERAYEVWPRLKKVDTSKAFNPNTNKSDTEAYKKELCKLVYGKTYGNDGYTSKPGKSNHKITKEFTGPFTDGYDGYRYRGGGYNQITFKSAYIKVKEASGVDVVNSPELIIKKGTAETACIGFFRRRIETFPSSKATAWNAVNGNSPSVSFDTLSDAVFYTYHCNTGTGKSVEHIKSLLDPSSKLGGMQKAQDRAPSLLAYVEEYLGLPASGDGLSESSSGDSGGSGGSGVQSQEVNVGLTKLATQTVWDPKSEKNILLLHPDMVPYAREFVNQAEIAGYKLRVTSTLRTFAEQSALYKKGRPELGGSSSDGTVTNAKAGSSYHNYGLAMDAVEVDPIYGYSKGYDTDRWDKIAKIGKGVGLEWGGDWKSFVDKPHFQLNKGTTTSLLALHNAGKVDSKGYVLV